MFLSCCCVDVYYILYGIYLVKWKLQYFTKKQMILIFCYFETYIDINIDINIDIYVNVNISEIIS